jgi:hypothetical protein
MKFVREDRPRVVIWDSGGPTVRVKKPTANGDPAEIGASAVCGLTAEAAMALANALLEAVAECNRLNEVAGLQELAEAKEVLRSRGNVPETSSWEGGVYSGSVRPQQGAPGGTYE